MIWHVYKFNWAKVDKGYVMNGCPLILALCGGSGTQLLASTPTNNINLYKPSDLQLPQLIIHFPPKLQDTKWPPSPPPPPPPCALLWSRTAPSRRLHPPHSFLVSSLVATFFLFHLFRSCGFFFLFFFGLIFVLKIKMWCCDLTKDFIF